MNGVIQQLRSSYQYLQKEKKPLQKATRYDFQEQKQAYVLQMIQRNTERLKIMQHGTTFKALVAKLERQGTTPEQALQILEEIAEEVAQTEPQQQSKTELNFTLYRLPEEIAEDMLADVEELEKCYATGCYRSCIILCGRLLEHGLHRIYYEASGVDILEKNPGIGLGTLIAKLTEMNFQFEPGISQQIHLINQIRIYSVHKKHNAFYPSKEQTHATILYTVDALNKLFRARPA